MDPLRQGIPARSSSRPIAQFIPTGQQKQRGLDILAGMLSIDTLQKCHRTLTTGLANHCVGDDEQGQVQDLFINRSSLFPKTCTRSGSLALAAFAFKIFGRSLLEDSTDRLDTEKLTIALQMVFGKATPAIQKDLALDIIVQRTNAREFVLRQRGYSIAVAPIDDPGQRQHAVDLFVTASNVSRDYFRTQTETSVLQVLDVEGGIPVAIGVQLPKVLSELTTPLQEGTAMHTSSVRSVMTDGTVLSSTMTLQYLVDDQLPPSRSDLERGSAEFLKAVTNEPLPTWRVRLIRSSNGVHSESQICAIAAKSRDDEVRTRTAALFVSDMFPDTAMQDEVLQQPAPRQSVLVDMRLLSHVNERRNHDMHVQAMQTVCEQSPQPITYLPLFQATHTVTTNWASRNRPVPSTLCAPPSSWLGPGSAGQLSRLIRDNFRALPEQVRQRFQPIADKTMTLIAATQHRINAIPLATFLTILFDLFNRYATDTSADFRLCMGCESAVGRTAAVITGVAMLEPLIQLTLLDHTDLHMEDLPFLNNRDTFELDCQKLSPEHRLLLADLHDPSLLMVTGHPLVGDPDDQPLQQFFSGLPFVTDHPS